EISIGNQARPEGTLVGATTSYNFTVTKVGPTEVTATVNFATAPGTATGAAGACPNGNDYQNQNGAVSFLANETSKTITILVCKDATFETDETFFVDLTGEAHATVTDNQGLGTIQNDDSPPPLSPINTTDDVVDVNGCDATHCSLREAINAANASATPVSIVFNIPATDLRHFYYQDDNVGSPGTANGQVTLANVAATTASDDTTILNIDPDWAHSWWSILPATPLPSVSPVQAIGVVIDGYTQPGASADTLAAGQTAILRIEIDGSSAGPAADGLVIGAGSNLVSGLIINSFSGNGLSIAAGTDIVKGNFIGTGASGTLDRGNTLNGILASGSSTVSIGGSAAGEANLISGNNADGIALTNSNSVTVQGNFIGTRANGTTALANGLNGISLSGGGSVFNAIGGSNAGEGNTIAFNTGDGISVAPSAGVGNTIRGNSIFANGTTPTTLGIDLGTDGVTANDALDADSGPNALQNFPVITSALVTGSTRTITGTLNSAASDTFIIDFYQSVSCDHSGNGEGQTYLGSVTTAATNGSGNVSFTFHPTVLTIGQTVTATATRQLAVDTYDNTSEFSACVAVTDGSPNAGDIQFVSATYGVGEAAGTASITVRRVGGSNGSVTSNFSTSNGSAQAPGDYTAVTNFPITFTEGETADKTVNVTIINDALFENSETVNLTLGNTTINATHSPKTEMLADPHQAVLTITDNDTAPSFSINDVTLAEGNGPGTTAFTFTVTKTGGTQLNATVDYATAPNTATTPADFAAISATTLTFLPGDTSKQVTVQVVGDNVFEGNDSFFVNLSNATNSSISDSQGVGTITNDDTQPAISIGDKSQVEGNSSSANFSFAVTLSNASHQTVTVNYTTVAGTATQPSDYTTAGGTVTFVPGDTSETVNVSVNGDTTFEADETFTVQLSSPSNATIADADGAGTIQNDDTAPTLSINDVAVTEGNGGTTNATFTVTLSAASGVTTTVNYATANGTATAPSDYTAIASTVLTFNPGETSKQVTVLVNGDVSFESDETFFVNLSGASGATISDNQGLGTIDDDDVLGGIISFSQAAYGVGESDKFITITVQRTGDTSNAATVEYASNDDSDPNAAVVCGTPTAIASSRCDFITAVGKINFAAGETSKTFDVLINQDSYSEGPEGITLTLSNPTGSAVLAAPSVSTVTITDDASEPVTNPIFEDPNFVRQHYLDFLHREPAVSEINIWVNVLTNCAPGDPLCDRVAVSSGFFGSPEYQSKSYFATRFYFAAFGRNPQFVEIMKDLSRLNGATPAESDAARAAFPAEFADRPDFHAAFDAFTNAQYVDTLIANTGVSYPNRNQMVSDLDTATKTRAQVLSDIVEAPQFVNNANTFNKAFILAEYFGYLRRNPDTAGFNAWLNYLTAHPGDYRTMVNGFVNSIEYRLRFGEDTTP
ncbi:MAG TPA: Calx-beta domain-containing protein, partial [Pyrinomonadaceae bacterium]|nr:Calx-beta domain-containing protein [Pyrinomonadaceae bacterium]